MMELVIGVLLFEDGGRGRSQEMQGVSGSWKRQGNNSPLKPPKGIQLCQQLDFRASGLWSCKIIYSCYSEPLVHGNLLQQQQKMNTTL